MDDPYGKVDLDLLASIASGGLGHWVEDVDGKQSYVKDDDCIACLKDLQGFFRNDDPKERPAFFAVSKYNFARSDLVPLIVTFPEDYDVVFNALKVCTLLTMPSTDPAATQDVARQASHMQQVCEAFLAQDALAVVVGMLADPLSRHPRMNERDNALVELVIAFLRNLLVATAPISAAPPAAMEMARRIRLGLLERLFADDVLDLALLMAQHARERPFKSNANVLLELFLALFTGTTPEQLLSADATLAALRAKRARARAATANDSASPASPAFHSLGRGGGAQRQQLGSNKAASNATRALLKRRQAPPAMRPPALPSSTLGRTVTRFGPHSQQFAGAVYIRRHLDHSSPTVVRHDPNKSELPRMSNLANPRVAKAQQRDTMASATAAFAGGASAAASAADLGRAVGSNALNDGGASLSPLPGTTIGVVSTVRDAEVLAKLDAYMRRFLQEAYTPLVGQVFREARPGLAISTLEEDDFERFARFVTFSTQYVRLKDEQRLRHRQRGSDGRARGDNNDDSKQHDDAIAIAIEREDYSEEARSPFECISSTMGWDAFHLVQVLLLTASDLEAQRARERRPSPRTHVLLHSLCPLLREMLLALDLARAAGNDADRGAADRLQRRLLHDDSKESGLMAGLVRLIKKYNFQRHPRTYATHLAENLHLVLATLDRLSTEGGFRVKQKSRKVGKKRRAGTTRNDENDDQATDANAEKQQEQPDKERDEDGVREERGDGAAEPRSDDARSRPQDATGDENPGQEEAERGGAPDLPGSDMPAANIVLEQGKAKDAGDVGTDENQQESPQKPESKENAAADAHKKDDDDDEDGVYYKVYASDDEDEAPRYREVDVDLPRRLRQALAQPSLVHFHSWLLQGYKTNRALTNHAIVAFLERIAAPAPTGLGLEPMLWQLSVLRLFHAIMSDASVRKDPQYAALLRLCVRTVRSLFKRLVPDTADVEAKLAAAEADIQGVARPGDHIRDRDGVTDAENRAQQCGNNDRLEGSAAAVMDVAVPESIGGVDGALSPTDQQRDTPQQQEQQQQQRDADQPPMEESAAQRKRMAEAELEARRRCSSLGFIEVMFWKGANVAEALGEEYNWRKAIEPVEHRATTTAGACGDQLGFASYRPPAPRGEFTDEQTQALIDAFERCNGRKDCLTVLVDEFSGSRLKKAHISRKLKALGLVRGKFTPRQDELLEELLRQHENKPTSEKFTAIADDLAAGFTANQVKRRLRDLGLLARRGAGGGGSKAAAAAAAWAEMLGSDDDDDDDHAADRRGGGDGAHQDDGSSSDSEDDDDDDGGFDKGVQDVDADDDDDDDDARAGHRKTAFLPTKQSSPAPNGSDLFLEDDEDNARQGDGMKTDVAAKPFGLESNGGAAPLVDQVDGGETAARRSGADKAVAPKKIVRKRKSVDVDAAKTTAGGEPATTRGGMEEVDEGRRRAAARMRSDGNHDRRGGDGDGDEEVELEAAAERARRAAALEALRKKRTGSGTATVIPDAPVGRSNSEDGVQEREEKKASGGHDDGEGASAAAPSPTDSPDGQKENNAHGMVNGVGNGRKRSAEQQKTFGRRWKKPGGAAQGAAAPPAPFDFGDLEDF